MVIIGLRTAHDDVVWVSLIIRNVHGEDRGSNLIVNPVGEARDVNDDESRVLSRLVHLGAGMAGFSESGTRF